MRAVGVDDVTARRQRCTARSAETQNTPVATGGMAFGCAGAAAPSARRVLGGNNQCTQHKQNINGLAVRHMVGMYRTVNKGELGRAITTCRLPSILRFITGPKTSIEGRQLAYC